MKAVRMSKRFGLTYLFCNDLEKMKWFYGEVLQLESIWESEASIAFQIGDHQLSIEYHEGFEIPSPHFAIQPGWEGGTEPRTSWSIEYDGETYGEVVQRVKQYGVKRSSEEPRWQGYWSFPLLDPMNNTIEITCTEEVLL